MVHFWLRCFLCLREHLSSASKTKTEALAPLTSNASPMQVHDAIECPVHKLDAPMLTETILDQTEKRCVYDENQFTPFEDSLHVGILFFSTS